MYFSRIRLRPENITAKRLTDIFGQNSYQDHQLVWRFFSNRPDADRDFLFRKEQVNNWPCFYVVSAFEPVDTSGIWRIETKAYRPQLRIGQKLAFGVRVNPVVTRWIETGGNRRQVRHDVVMDAKKALNFNALPVSERPNSADLIQDAGVKWILSRCQSLGFSVIDRAIRVDGYRQHRVFKRGRNYPIRFSTLEYTGLLTVENPDCFRQTLFQGIGKSRALGCGLLMVKPVRN